VALFGATSTGDQPGFFPVDTHRTYALALSVLVIVIVLIGLWLASKSGELRWRDWSNQRVLTLVALMAVAITALIVALTERPRSEYIYGLSIGLLALTGYCLRAILRHWGWAGLAAPLALFVVLVLAVALPSHYKRGPRPLRDAIERLQVVRPELQRPGSVLVTSSYNWEICSYLAEDFNRFCASPSWAQLAAQIDSGSPVQEVLGSVRADVIYADPLLQRDRAMAGFLASPRAAGWRKVSEGDSSDGPWSVLIRQAARQAQPASDSS
jgi:hypothetical protein